MRIHAGFVCAVVSCALALGCSKDKAEPSAQQEPPEQQPVKPEPPKPEPPKPEPVQLANNAKNCPSAVTGAKTVIAEADGVVVVTVTAEGDEPVAEIRKRAQHLTKVMSVAEETGGHTGTGTAGGDRGMCPVVLNNTTLAAEEVKGGAKLTITPKDASALAEVKGAAEHRLAQLSRRAEGFHTGKQHGSGTGGGQGKGEGGGEGAEKTAGAAAPKDKPKRPNKKLPEGGGW